jgi:hypothetical protein
MSSTKRTPEHPRSYVPATGAEAAAVAEAVPTPAVAEAVAAVEAVPTPAVAEAVAAVAAEAAAAAAEAAEAVAAASEFGGVVVVAAAAAEAGTVGCGPNLAGFGLANQSASESKNLRQRLGDSSIA